MVSHFWGLGLHPQCLEVDVGGGGGLWCGTGINSSLSHTLAHALLGPTDRAVGPGVLELGVLGQREELVCHPDAEERVGSLSAICRPQSHLHPQGLFGIPPTTHDRPGLGIST